MYLRSIFMSVGLVTFLSLFCYLFNFGDKELVDVFKYLLNT